MNIRQYNCNPTEHSNKHTRKRAMKQRNTNKHNTQQYLEKNGENIPFTHKCDFLTCSEGIYEVITTKWQSSKEGNENLIKMGWREGGRNVAYITRNRTKQTYKQVNEQIVNQIY